MMSDEHPLWRHTCVYVDVSPFITAAGVARGPASNTS